MHHSYESTSGSNGGKVINVSFTKEQVKVLITMVNYLYASNVNFDAIEDPAERDKRELDFYRSVAAMESVKKDDERSFLDCLQPLFEAMTKEYEEEEKAAIKDDDSVTTPSS